MNRKSKAVALLLALCAAAIMLFSTGCQGYYIDSSALPFAIVGEPYDFPLEGILIDDGDDIVPNAALTWRITGGAPAWMRLNSAAGRLSGTPNAPGTYQVSIELSGNTGGSIDQKTFSLYVVNAVAVSPAAFVERNAPAALNVSVDASGLAANPYNRFGGVQISRGGAQFTPLSSADYTLDAAQFRLSLTQTYLNTLSEGAYALRLSFLNASADADAANIKPPTLTVNFTVTPYVPAPNTGDGAPLWLWAGLAACALAAMAALMLKRGAARGSGKH